METWEGYDNKTIGEHLPEKWVIEIDYYKIS